MIVVTGAYGFIGSCLVAFLNAKGHTNIVAVDDFSREDKAPNLAEKQLLERVERTNFEAWFTENAAKVTAVFHLGARTDTTEQNHQIFDELNTEYSKMMWQLCTQSGVPLLYASSAATYGDGKLGYSDDHQWSRKLVPLNPYGASKNEFDIWVLNQKETPPFWAGMKFFNVFGPNEYHKGRMASVVWHFFRQIRDTGKVRLFESYAPNIPHGEQMRDFVYVNDVTAVLYFLFERASRTKSGIYNLGTGKARSYNDLAKAIFSAMNLPENIEYVPMPDDLRAQYQYYTQADMSKLNTAEYDLKTLTSLEEGITHYVTHFLETGAYY